MLSLSTGITYQEPNCSDPGFILLAPCGGDRVYLVSKSGELVHEWNVGRGLTFWCYLLPNGNLFTNERLQERKGVALTGSGIMREYDAQSRVVWEHVDPFQHHDARKLSTGGAVYLAYTELSAAQQKKIKGGVKRSEPDGQIYGEVIREVDSDGAVVWERVMHEFGTDFPLHSNANRWSTGHTNTVVPIDRDRFLISCKVLNLIFIFDRSSDQITWHYQDDAMGGQHDAQMLENGNILLFANGAYSSDLHHSQVWEIDPNTQEIVWKYKAIDNPQGFFSPHIGGCQRLRSGNTLVCEGAKGCIFEVTKKGEVVWEYVNPYFNEVPEFGKINWLFRARSYDPDSPEIRNSIGI